MKNTFKDYLKEAPIGDYETLGDWSKGSSFRDPRDRKLIRHPTAIERVKKKFGNTDYLFNFYFLNSKEANKHTEVGLVKPEWVKKNLGDEAYNAISQHLDDDSINVIFTNNKGAEKVVMTAWIMAHRIGHALAREDGSRSSYAYQQAMDHLISTFAMCMEFYGKQNFPTSERKLMAYGYNSDHQSARRNQLVMLSFFYEVGGFRSARQRDIRDWFEVLNEMIAQYLTTGKIKFRPAPEQFGLKGPKGFQFRTEEVDEVNEVLESLGRDMEYYIDTILGGVVNGVLVM